MGDGTLVPSLPQASQGFPDILGVVYNGLVNELTELDTSVQPPDPVSGYDYVVLVPRVDEDGNDIAGIRLPDIGRPSPPTPAGTCAAPASSRGRCAV